MDGWPNNTVHNAVYSFLHRQLEKKQAEINAENRHLKGEWCSRMAAQSYCAQTHRHTT